MYLSHYLKQPKSPHWIWQFPKTFNLELQPDFEMTDREDAKVSECLEVFLTAKSLMCCLHVRNAQKSVLSVQKKSKKSLSWYHMSSLMHQLGWVWFQFNRNGVEMSGRGLNDFILTFLFNGMASFSKWKIFNFTP